MSSPAPDLPPREALLARALEFLSERGLSDLSLRDIAAALGTSHRMLIYHFGSKEGLFVEIVRETERRQRQVLAGLFEGAGGTLADAARSFWSRLCAPALAPHERLFFEVYAQALQGRPYAQSLLDGVVDSWTEPAAALLRSRGLSGETARAEARLGLAVVRGLLLDLLATGDRAAVDAAFERYLVGALSRL